MERDPSQMLNESQVDRGRVAAEDELFDEMESSSSQLSGLEELTDQAQDNLNGTKGAADDAKNNQEQREMELLKEVRKLQLENQDLRASLNEVGDRVVPTMIRSDKENCLAVYDRNIEGKRRLRVTRTQLRQLEAFDKKMEEYRINLSKRADSKRYGWLKRSEKLMDIKCPNAVKLWAKVCEDNPHKLYGIRFLNRIKTEFEFLDEEELREKFNGDNKDQKPWFMELNLVDEDDAVNKCLTRSDEARELVCGLIIKSIEINKAMLQPTEREEEVENE